MSGDKKKAKIHKPSGELQRKAGRGTVNERLVSAAAKVVENNAADFQPMANELLAMLQTALTNMKESPEQATAEKQQAIVPVMQIKANAAMFGYKSVGQIATLLLDFLEDVGNFDPAVIEIITACHQSITLLVAKNIKSEQDQVATIMRKEITTVINRYKDKFSQNIK